MKSKKDFMKKVQNKQVGFTLMELIVTIAILGVVMLAIFSFLGVGNNFFRVSSQSFDSQNESRLATYKIEEEIRYASDMELNVDVSDGTLSILETAGRHHIYFKDNKLYIFTPTDSNPRLLASNIDTATSYFRINSNQEIQIVVNAKKGNQSYQLESTLKLVNLKLTNKVITNNTGGTGKGNIIIFAP